LYDRKEIFDCCRQDFFRLVSRLTFSNPFEADTFELAYKTVGGRFRSKATLNKKLIAAIEERLEEKIPSKKISWKDFSGEDRELIRVALLYDVYHNCMAEFDELILQQIEECARA